MFPRCWATERRLFLVFAFVESKTRPYHGRIGSGRRTVGRGGPRRGWAGRDAYGSVRQGDNRPSWPQGIVDNCLERFPRSTNNGPVGPKTRTSMGGTGRGGARRDGGAGQGRAGAGRSFARCLSLCGVPLSVSGLEP